MADTIGHLQTEPQVKVVGSKLLMLWYQVIDLKYISRGGLVALTCSKRQRLQFHLNLKNIYPCSFPLVQQPQEPSVHVRPKAQLHLIAVYWILGFALKISKTWLRLLVKFSVKLEGFPYGSQRLATTIFMGVPIIFELQKIIPYPNIVEF